MRLAILTSHPIQYYAPLFRHMAKCVDLHVFFAHAPTPAEQAQAGFGTAFSWDIDLTSGYSHSFLRNVARLPSTSRFSGCDTPEIGARLKEGRFDALLCLGWHLKTFLQGLWAARRMGLATLVRGDSQLETPRVILKRVSKELMYPPFLRLFDAALYVGQRNRAYYRYYSYPEQRLFHSPHCIDTERFQNHAGQGARDALRRELGVVDKTKLVLFAGKLVPFKQPLLAIDAIAHVRSRGLDVQALIAGAGPLAAAVLDRARHLDVPLHMLGFQNQSRMPAVYSAADVLLLPSNSEETWGLVCNEAIACRIPIVVSDSVGCAPDLAADGVVGRSFPNGDVNACAKALLTVLQSPPSPDAIRMISSRFTFEAATQGLANALDMLALRKLKPITRPIP